VLGVQNVQGVRDVLGVQNVRGVLEVLGVQNVRGVHLCPSLRSALQFGNRGVKGQYGDKVYGGSVTVKSVWDTWAGTVCLVYGGYRVSGKA
jgi:hypothetical protein